MVWSVLRPFDLSGSLYKDVVLLCAFMAIYGFSLELASPFVQMRNLEIMQLPLDYFSKVWRLFFPLFLLTKVYVQHFGIYLEM